MQDHKKRGRNHLDDIAGTSIDNESPVAEQMSTAPEVDITTGESVDGGQTTEAVTSEAVNETDKLTQELAESKDKYIRLFAEFENFKRRNAKERMELIQTAGKDVITSLLPVLDDCDRAEKQMNNSDDINHLKEGVSLVFNKLRNTLQSKGLTPMESINKDFEVEKHEAIAQIEVPDPALKGKVIDEVEKGYYLNNKLIRFAKVIVGK
jgi:molecular chaperone GrpE